MRTDRLPNDDGVVANTPSQSTTRQQPPRSAYRRRNSGASLVEVLIVLVIILIGVFAVIQIFPIGFTSLKKSEARLRADRLARNVTESLTTDASALPESISFSYYNGAGVLNTETGVDPDNLGVYGATPAEQAANKLYFSDVNKFRYIKNEPIRVPLATATGSDGFGSGVGSVHFLTFGPIYMNKTVGDPTVAPDYNDQASIDLYNSYLKVTSERLFGVVVDSIDPGSDTRLPAARFAGTLRGASTYAIDYGDEDDRTDDANERPVILFAPQDVVRVFEITFLYEDEVSGSSVVKQGTCKVTVPANSFNWIPLFDNDSNDDGTIGDDDLLLKKPIQSGSESVIRQFVRLAAGDTWSSTDPYQYKVVSANVSDNANLGVIAFNPAGANFSVSVPGGTKPFTALASYAVLDWHILRDDREVPVGSDGVGKVRTSLPGIRLRGDDFVDLTQTGANRNQVYPGLYPQQAVYTSNDPLPSNAISPDIQVFNLNDPDGTAKLLVAGDLANRLGVDSDKDYWINRAGRGGTYPTGTIYINTNKVTPGSKVRILYKAQGDWAVSFQKAAKAYRREEASLRPVANKAEVFAVDPVASPSGTPYADDRIYFHRTELNKGVTAVFEIDTAAGTTRLPARQFSIQNPDGFYSYAVASEVVPELSKSQYNGQDITGWRVAFDTVNGASLKTRVIWQDEQNGRNPWRISDLETFVTRQGQ